MDTKQTEEPAEKSSKRFSWKEFLHLHQLFHTLHPAHWNIEWSRLPKSIERDTTNDPVYFKTGRSDEPHRVVVYHEHEVVASRSKDGYWETIERDNRGRPTLYQNSFGCQMALVWGEQNTPYPLERIEHGHRWILVAYHDHDAVYWCPRTDYFYINNRAMPRRDLNSWFCSCDWKNPALINMVNEALKMPFTRLGRYNWQRKHPAPTNLCFNPA